MFVCIYIYILSSTDRLFSCITTHQSGETHKILQAGIETLVTLCQSDNIPHMYIYTHIHESHSKRSKLQPERVQETRQFFNIVFLVL